MLRRLHRQRVNNAFMVRVEITGKTGAGQKKKEKAHAVVAAIQVIGPGHGPSSTPSHHEDWTGRVAHHALGGAAEERVLQAGVAVRGEDDDVHLAQAGCLREPWVKLAVSWLSRQGFEGRVKLAGMRAGPDDLPASSWPLKFPVAGA